MAAQPARRARPRPAPAAPAPAGVPARARAARIEARRRRRHVQRLRRDLLVDFALAFALSIALVIITAGLGVIALLEIPATAAVIASFVLQRRRVVKKSRQARKIDHARR